MLCQARIFYKIAPRGDIAKIFSKFSLQWQYFPSVFAEMIYLSNETN